MEKYADLLSQYTDYSERVQLKNLLDKEQGKGTSSKRLVAGSLFFLRDHLFYKDYCELEEMLLAEKDDQVQMAAAESRGCMVHRDDYMPIFKERKNGTRAVQMGNARSFAYTAWHMHSKQEDIGYFVQNERLYQAASRSELKVQYTLDLAAGAPFNPAVCVIYIKQRLHSKNPEVRRAAVYASLGLVLSNQTLDQLTPEVNNVLAEMDLNGYKIPGKNLWAASIDDRRKILCTEKRMPVSDFDSFKAYVDMYRQFYERRDHHTKTIPKFADAKTQNYAEGMVISARQAIANRGSYRAAEAFLRSPLPKQGGTSKGLGLLFSKEIDYKRVRDGIELASHYHRLAAQERDGPWSSLYARLLKRRANLATLANVVACSEMNPDNAALLLSLARCCTKEVYIGVNKWMYANFPMESLIPQDLRVYKYYRPTEKGSQILRANDRRIEDAVTVSMKAGIQKIREYPNISGVIEAYYDPRVQSFVIIEEGAHGSLQDIIGEPVDVPVVLDLTFQMLKSQDQARQMGISLKDIKPSNFLLRWLDSKLVVMATDLDQAEILGILNMAKRTKATEHPLYCDFRKLCTDDTCNPITDRFPIGLIEYELAMGEHAYVELLDGLSIPKDGSAEWNRISYDEREKTVDQPIKETLIRMGHRFDDYIGDSIRTKFPGKEGDALIATCLPMVTFDLKKRENPFKKGHPPGLFTL